MSNIKAEINSKYIYLDFGIYAGEPFNLKSPFVVNKDTIDEFGAYGDGMVLYTNGINQHTMYFTHEAIPPIISQDPEVEDIHFLIVDSIDGVKPDSIEDIIQLIFKSK